MKIHYLPLGRIGNIKPPQGSRPRPVRIHFPESVDRLEIWKSRSRLKATHLTLSEDLPRRERIQRSILSTLTQALIATNQNWNTAQNLTQTQWNSNQRKTSANP